MATLRMYKIKKISIISLLIISAITVILFQVFFYHPIDFKKKDKAGHTAVYVASLLHKAKKNCDGKLASQMISQKLINEFASLNLGLNNKKKIAQVFTLVWKYVKKKVPSEFSNLNFKENNTFIIPFRSHVLIIDLDTVSPQVKQKLMKGKFSSLSTKIKDSLTGYSIILENGYWKFNGFYNLKNGYESLASKKDELELIQKFSKKIQ